ncbi:MAG: hypothetical protein AAGH79_19050 [Bacteroidota bacterium]
MTLFRLTFLLLFSLLVFPTDSWSQKFRKYQFTSVNMSNSPLETNHIRDILFDEEGGAYIATGGLGLIYWKDETWIYLQHPDLPQTGWFNDLEWGPEGWLWIAGGQEVILYHPKRKKWSSLPFPIQSFHITVNSKGVMICGGGNPGSNQGFYQWDGSQWIGVDRGHRDVMGLYVCQNDDVLISYRDGTWRYPASAKGYYNLSSEQVSEMAFYELGEDSHGTLWGASYSKLKLHSLVGDQWQTHVGVPSRMKYKYRDEPTYSAHNMLVLPDDRVVVSTQFMGFLAIWDGEDWEAYGLPLLKSHGGIQRVVQHPDGSIWCATWDSGLAIFHPYHQSYQFGTIYEPR